MAVGAYIGCGITFALVSPVWLVFFLLYFITGSNLFLGPPIWSWNSCIADATNNSTTAPLFDDGSGGGGGDVGGRRHHHHLRFLLEKNNAVPLWDHEESSRSLEWIQPIVTTATVASDGKKK
jgi:hypothetical protein